MSSVVPSANPTQATTPVASATSTPAASSTSSATPTSSSTTPSSSNSASSTSSVVSSSSSSSSASASSSGPSSVASSTTSSSSTSSTSSRSSSSSSISFVVQTSNGQVFTQTSVITIPNSTPTQETQASQSPKGFIHNTGAVAAVFSVAGVIALVAIFFLLTSLIRRRRARKLDREIDEAAAAAAASARAPDFGDLDYTSGTGYGHYSETSHGTYNQPPLSHEPTHNNLGDMPTSFEPYSAAAGAGAGAAGIGARGRSLHAGRQPDPYGALANPPEQYEMYETRRSWHQGNPQGGPGLATYDLLHAAGLAGSDPYAVTRRTSTTLSHSQSQSGISGLTRNQSQGASTLPTTAESYPISTPAPGYPDGQDTPYLPEKARYSASYAPGGGVSTMPPDGDEDAYGGYHDQPSAPLENPHSPGIGEPHAREDGLDEVVGRYEDGSYTPEEPARASIADDEDYGFSGRRVLRVANE